MSSRDLQTVAEVLDALGGPSELARQLGGSVQRLTNCHQNGNFPATLFDRMDGMLRGKGYRAPKELWRQE